MVNTEQAKHAFLRRLGDVSLAEKEYFNQYHRELNADEYIDAALDDCRAYFGCDDIPSAVTNSTVADIAYIRYQLDTVQGKREFGLKSASYSEGSVSQSETYATGQEINASIENTLKQYSRFRVVNGRANAENTE